MKNQVIKSDGPEHGKDIIKYWKSHGVDTRDYIGETPGSYCYYGVIDNHFDNFTQAHINNRENVEIIELIRKGDVVKIIAWGGCNSIHSFNENGYTELFGEYVVSDVDYSNDDFGSYTVKINNVAYRANHLKKCANPEKEKFLSGKDAQRIINIACPKWREKLAKIFATRIVLGDEIIISNEFYSEMRLACTPEQHILFDEIFGPDEPIFKKGDWVVFCLDKAIQNNCQSHTWNKDKTLQILEVYVDILSFEGPNGKINNYAKCFRHATPEEITIATAYPKGSPCLVRNVGQLTWLFKYADGNGRFYIQDKSGTTTTWAETILLTQEIPE